MLELLQMCWGLVIGLASAGSDLVMTVILFGWSVLEYLHVEAPRLEGLLVGIALAWVLLRRDKHPLLRVLSSPLKLILDIFDLAWDQCIEVLRDVWGTCVSWVEGALGWCRDRVVGVWSRIMGGLGWLRDKLRRS